MKPLVLLCGILPVLLMAQPDKPVLGSVTGFVAEKLQMEVQPDSGTPLAISFDASTVVQRIAPGQTSLKNAETIPVTSVAIGDRVLVNFLPGTTQARRIVVMAASDIAKRQQADREDWNKRGITGIVSEKRGNTVTLRVRTSLMAPESTATVVANEKTVWRRYAPDSVKFADAITATVSDLKSGDQLRARGTKAADGLRVDAEEIVFGTFLTSAGTVSSIDAATGIVTVQPLNAGKNAKPLTVRVAKDSQVKRMPDFAAGGPGGGGPPPMMMGRGGPGGPGGGPGGPGGGPGGGGPPDIGRMIERMPSVAIDALKPGETVVVSSTKGNTDGDVTAIVLLANADFLIRMATMQQQQAAAAAQRGARGGGGGMMGGAGGGAGAMMGGDLGGMFPGFMQ